MPSVAWSNWGELRAYSDCTTDALGDPHLGEANVTIPNWKTKDLRLEKSLQLFLDFIPDRLPSDFS